MSICIQVIVYIIHIHNTYHTNILCVFILLINYQPLLLHFSYWKLMSLGFRILLSSLSPPKKTLSGSNWNLRFECEFEGFPRGAAQVFPSSAVHFSAVSGSNWIDLWSYGFKFGAISLSKQRCVAFGLRSGERQCFICCCGSCERSCFALSGWQVRWLFEDFESVVAEKGARSEGG